MNVIVTGSSGFIGSRLVTYLLKQYKSDNIFVYGIDSKPRPNILINVIGYAHFQIDITNLEPLIKIFVSVRPVLVFHLAGSIMVTESSLDPGKYYKNNTIGTYCIVEAMKHSKARNLVYASTAAVYQYQNIPLKEDHPLNPVSVYGRTKLCSEKIIHDYCKAHDIKSVIFRFFNVAGGKDHNTSQHHLIPVVIEKLLKGDQINIYGNDYDTIDGTCIRDYIHVDDIVHAHYLAAQQLLSDSNDKIRHVIYNLGSMKRHTVLQVIELCLKHLDESILVRKYTVTNRRTGDPDILIADTTKAQTQLDWVAIKGIDQIILDTINEFVLH